MGFITSLFESFITDVIDEIENLPLQMNNLTRDGGLQAANIHGPKLIQAFDDSG